MKLLSQGEDRPQDSVDLQQLLQQATTTDLNEARTALRLIRERDHHGGKDLLGALEAAVARHGPDSAGEE